MIVDVHTHIWQNPAQFGSQIGERLGKWLRLSSSPTEVTPVTHRAAMSQVPISFVLGYKSLLLDAFIPHEFISSCVNQFPNRVLGFAGMDPLDKHPLKELDKIKQFGLHGIVISPADSNFHPQHTRAMGMYEKCEAMKLPIIVHQGTTMMKDSNLEFARPHHFDDVARAFPNLKIIISHCGFPFTDELLAMIGKHDNVYTDIAWVATRSWQLYHILMQAHQLDVMKKFFFGSDYPFSTPEDVVKKLFQLNQFCVGTGLPSIPREKIRQMIERDVLGCLDIHGFKPEVTEEDEELDALAEGFAELHVDAENKQEGQNP